MLMLMKGKYSTTTHCFYNIEVCAAGICDACSMLMKGKYSDMTHCFTKLWSVLQVSVMHAFIDEGKYSDMTIDKALRQMLKDFKLPGKHSTCIGFRIFSLSSECNLEYNNSMACILGFRI